MSGIEGHSRRDASRGTVHRKQLGPGSPVVYPRIIERDAAGFAAKQYRLVVQRIVDHRRIVSDRWTAGGALLVPVLCQQCCRKEKAYQQRLGYPQGYPAVPYHRLVSLHLFREDLYSLYRAWQFWAGGSVF